MKALKRHGPWVILALVALLAWPPQWYPESLRLTLTRWFGAADYRPLPASLPVDGTAPEPFCPPAVGGWRDAQTIEGVDILAAPTCAVDNPQLVAAAVRGTNNVGRDTLLASGLTADAVEKGADLDGDGDPDEIHIRLEVVELNGASPIDRRNVTRYAIAPGIEPGLWVFAPKLAGMAVENLDTQRARDALRLPAPAIRIEQGDRVRITLENTHYMPHTLHLHGADHPFTTADGQGNDGVPITSEIPLLPGSARTYELTPRHAGTMFYHCHVQPQVHVMMGLQGLFVVEENRANNWLQTLNVGAGQLRAPSVASRERYAAEYDLHYQDLDSDLTRRLQADNDPRLVTKSMHRDYDTTDATSDYFLLNGKSFPYTFRESLVVAHADDTVYLRVLNGGAKGMALHTHGHKFTIAQRDGVPVPEAARSPQDVAWLATAQRIDVTLDFTNDGLHAYGPGIWPFHDHQPAGVTTDGIGPGGNLSAIVYAPYLGDDGWPLTRGVSWNNYFTAGYYRRNVPVWESYAPGLFGDPGTDRRLFARLLIVALALGGLLGLVLRRRLRR